MKIVKAEVFVTCPGRNFVTLKITTEDGITGLGVFFFQAEDGIRDKAT